MIAVWKHELKNYFHSLTAYIFGAFLLAFIGLGALRYNIQAAVSNFEFVLSYGCLIFVVIVPILTMRVIAEERRQKTDQLLYSLPIRLSSVVMGKYLAMLTVLAVPTLILCLYPLVLSQFGTINYATAYGAIIGFFLMGGCLLSIGLFISSATESQVSAAVVTLGTMLLLYFMSSLASFLPTDASSSLSALMVTAIVLAVILYLLTKNSFVSVLAGAVMIGGLYLWYQADSSVFSGLFAKIMEALSVFDRFDTFVEGVFDLNCVVYYLSITGVCLFLTVQSMEKRRWSE